MLDAAPALPNRAPRRPALSVFAMVALGMTAAHLDGVQQLLVAAAGVAAAFTLPGRRLDRSLAVGLLLTGAVMETLRVISLPTATIDADSYIEVSGEIAPPVRHTGAHRSSDLTLSADATSLDPLRLRILLPDSLGDLIVGKHVTVRGRFSALRHPRNPGQNDWDSSLRRKGGMGTVWVDSIWREPRYDHRSMHWRMAIRSAIEGAVHRVIGSREATLAFAVLLGCREGLDQETYDDFREAGIIHILAISGLHVLVVIGLLFWFGRVILPGYRLPALITLLGLGIYIYLVGPQASVVRAGIMGGTVLLGLALRKASDPANSVGIAGIVLLWLDPRLLWEPGFQLSFSATMGILLFTPPVVGLIRTLPRTLKWPASALAASFGAQMAVFPIVLFHFHQWPSFGLLANVPAVFFLTTLLWMTVGSLTAGIVWPAAGALLGCGARFSARGLYAVAGITASLPGSLQVWGAPVTWILLILWLGTMGALVGWKKRRLVSGSTVGVLVGVNAWLLWQTVSPWEQPVERAIMLHVSAGNCIVVDHGGEQFVVIDPGASGRSGAAFKTARDYLLFRRGRRFDPLLATSLGRYRFGACGLLVEEGLVERIWLPAGAGERIEGTTTTTGWRGGVPAAIGPWLQAIPLNPGRSAIDGLCLKSARGLRILIAGEGGWKADTRLAARTDLEQVDVLYVGPARVTGPSQLLLRKAQPGLIVMGESSRMEPRLVERLEASGYEVAWTENGAIVVENDGSRVTWWQWKQS